MKLLLSHFTSLYSFKNKICRIHKFKNENKKLTIYLRQIPITKYIKLPVILENSKIFKIYAYKKIHICSHMSIFI